MNYLITIVGPTAIGKTALSIALANHYNCEIISCDSRQFFKELKIGTAVPSNSELLQAKHHFIQNKSIFDDYTVGDFEKEALSKLENLYKTNNIAILVGGSGLYVDAVLKGFDFFPEIDTNIKNDVQLQYETFGIAYLQKKLNELDNYYFQKLLLENPQTLQNPQRMLRFVSVCVGTNKPYSSYLNHQKIARNFVPILVGLEANRTVIYDRINQRVDTMIKEGLLNEAKNVYLHKSCNALQTVGYRELFQFFDSAISLKFAIEEIKKNTRRFSKRQLTWFKKLPNVIWFDYLEPKTTIISHINKSVSNSNQART